MNELSIFIDESGDFGEYDYRSPYYIISMVIHNQTSDISQDLQKLNNDLSHLNFPDHCIHAGPLIRQEGEYHFIDIATRRKILKHLVSFVRRIDIKCTSIYIDKKNIGTFSLAVSRLQKQLSILIKNKYDYFLSFDKVIIYYDNGQTEVTQILSSVFYSILDNIEFRKVLPFQYRLFQVADLVCTLKLAELKLQKHNLSNSEKIFFSDERTLKKNYLKPINSKYL